MDMETIKSETLTRLKMLLGIKDDEQDSLLSFLIDDVINLILGYCRIEVLPRQLESLVPVIAADLYRIKGYGSSDAPRTVKTVTEGENAITYESAASEDSLLRNYYKRLNPFKNRQGFVPSDLGRSGDNE